MKVGERVTIEHRVPHLLHESRRVSVVVVRGDYVYLDVPGPIGIGGEERTAFHRRTGRPRRACRWRLALKHVDPKAGRGETR